MLAKEFDAEVVDTFRINKIDGETLLELTQEEMKELGIVALVDRKKLVKLTKTLLTIWKDAQKLLHPTRYIHLFH